MKIVATKQYGEVIGCQIIGHHATDLISEVVLGKTLESTTAEFGHTVHPHPTMSEAIMEAALAAEGARSTDEGRAGSPVDACALGGHDGRTRYACAAPDFNEAARTAAQEASLIAMRVAVPAA